MGTGWLRGTLRPHWPTALWTIAGLALVACAVAAWVVVRGVYDVSATKPHTQVVYSLLEKAMHQSVKQRAARVVVPQQVSGGDQRAATACFRDLCVQCHGAPGVAPGAIGMGLQPIPGSLADAAKRWTVAELYWITRHGLKMTGMPAWENRLSETELWSVAYFVAGLPAQSPQDYAHRVMQAEGQACTASPDKQVAAGARDVLLDSRQRGRQALNRYTCQACHVIPGVTGSESHVGPPLSGMGRRETIAGGLRNTEDNLVRWIRFPKTVDPRSAMPDLGVSEADARDMAAYLRTLP